MMTKTEFLNNLVSEVYCRLGVSTIHGVGVRAIREIPKGTNPMPEIRQTEFIQIPSDDVCELSTPFRELIKDMCPLNDGFYEVPNYSMNEIGISYYLNHSPTPNMGTDDGGDFYALRDIEPGEELTVDYGTYGALNL
jgi:SET domain-containing protein